MAAAVRRSHGMENGSDCDDPILSAPTILVGISLLLLGYVGLEKIRGPAAKKKKPFATSIRSERDHLLAPSTYPSNCHRAGPPDVPPPRIGAHVPNPDKNSGGFHPQVEKCPNGDWLAK